MKDYTATKVQLPSLDIYLEQTLTAKQKLSLNVVTTDRYQDTERRYEETKDSAPSYTFLTQLTSNAYSVIGEGIYENELGAAKLNIGLKHLQKWTNNDYRLDVLTQSAMQQSSEARHVVSKHGYRRLYLQ